MAWCPGGVTVFGKTFAVPCGAEEMPDAADRASADALDRAIAGVYPPEGQWAGTLAEEIAAR